MTMTAEQYIEQVIDAMPRATPLRAQIAMELRGHIAERVGNGQPLAEVIKQLGDPGMLAESYLAAEPLIAANPFRRLAAKTLDILVVLAAIVPVLLFTGLLARSEGVWVVLLLILLIGTTIVFFFYTIAAETLFSQTIGKWLLSLRVVRESGARISLGQAIVRQLPAVLQVGWIDAMFALFTEKSQRAFEMLSKTRVVVASQEVK